jgi:hypothetical protein
MPSADATRAQIGAVLEGMTTHQLYDMIAQMKGLIEQSPDQARQVLEANPQFAYALLQAELILGMVNPQVVKVSACPRLSLSLSLALAAVCHLTRVVVGVVCSNCSSSPERRHPCSHSHR